MFPSFRKTYCHIIYIIRHIDVPTGLPWVIHLHTSHLEWYPAVLWLCWQHGWAILRMQFGYSVGQCCHSAGWYKHSAGQTSSQPSHQQQIVQSGTHLLWNEMCKFGFIQAVDI